MKTTKLISLSLLCLTTAIPMTGHAQEKQAVAQTYASAAAPASAMTDGEIRNVDKHKQKITIKHGEIKNLDMPSMTMVFMVKDAALLNKVKAGDKVKFTAEKMNGEIVVTDILKLASGPNTKSSVLTQGITSDR